MSENELLTVICRNIYNHGWALQDAPFRGVTVEQRQGAEWALDKILDGTGYDSLTIINAVREDD